MGISLEDMLLSREEILAKYPAGSPDYPSHSTQCQCSGCWASWGEWRAGRVLVPFLRTLESDLAASRASESRLADQCADRDIEIGRLESQVAALTAERDGLARGVLAYAHHKSDCYYRNHGGDYCTCGFDAVQKAAREAGK